MSLSVKIEPSNAANQDVTWSTSNSDIVTVDNTGLVTGVSEGVATITVTTDDGGHTATCTVTVHDAVTEPEPGDIIILDVQPPFGTIGNDYTHVTLYARVEGVNDRATAESVVGQMKYTYEGVEYTFRVRPLSGSNFTGFTVEVPRIGTDSSTSTNPNNYQGNVNSVTIPKLPEVPTLAEIKEHTEVAVNPASIGGTGVMVTLSGLDIDPAIFKVTYDGVEVEFLYSRYRVFFDLEPGYTDLSDPDVREHYKRFNVEFR